MNRRDILIAMAQAGVLTKERALQVRSLYEHGLIVWLLKEEMPEAVMLAADAPILGLQLGKRRPSAAYVQEQVDLHLLLVGFEPAPVEYLHPHLAGRILLHERWEAHFVNKNADWALHFAPHRVARIFAHGRSDAWKPLLNLIERGVHPYGLSPEGGRFFLVDTRADHLREIQEAWNAAVAR